MDVLIQQPWFMLQGLPQAWQWGVLAAIGILGACFGSFLHLVAVRFLANESIVAPGSKCDGCNTPLKWFENIPLLAWPLLGGKCRTCGVRISMDAWLTEIATAGLFMAIAWFAGMGWATLFWWFFIANMVVIFLTDLKEHLIFQVNSLSLVPAGVLMHVLGLGQIAPFAFKPASAAVVTLPLQMGNAPLDVAIPYGLVSALMGVLLSIVFFEGAIWLSRKCLGTDGFGHGDTHLMMGVGAYLGIEAMAVALMLGFVLQAVLALPMLVMQWVREQQWVIFGAGTASLGFALFPYFGMGWARQLGLDSLTTLLLALAGAVVCLLVFLRELRNQEHYVYIPLGPALILGSVGMVFYILAA